MLRPAAIYASLRRVSAPVGDVWRPLAFSSHATVSVSPVSADITWTALARVVSPGPGFRPVIGEGRALGVTSDGRG